MILEEGYTKMDASDAIAHVVFKVSKSNKDSHQAHSVRTWANQFYSAGVFTATKRGKNTKNKSIINDPKIREYLRETLSLMGKKRCPRLFQQLLSNPDTNLLGKIEDIYNVRAPLKVSPNRAQRTWLTETVQNSGHSVIYLPKFHCELNPIEMFWAFVKGKARAECGYSIGALDKKVPECMIACPVSTIRKYVRHCLRYMDGYRKGLTGPLLDFACKKYTSHRRICEKLIDHVKELEDTKQEFVNYKKIKRENW
eukprot:gene3359-4325_t